MSCGVGLRQSSDLALLWLWHRQAACISNFTSILGASISFRCSKKKKKKERERERGRRSRRKKKKKRRGGGGEENRAKYLKCLEKKAPT